MTTHRTAAALDFEIKDALSEAEDKAKPGFEEEFVTSMQQRFKNYGYGMLASDRQEETLRRIAGMDG